MGKENVLRFSLTVFLFKSVSIQLLRLFINVVVLRMDGVYGRKADNILFMKKLLANWQFHLKI